MPVVVVQCFHCNAVMELDEGFRGGVCRCSGCVDRFCRCPRGNMRRGSGRHGRRCRGWPQAEVPWWRKLGLRRRGRYGQGIDPGRWIRGDRVQGCGGFHQTRPVPPAAAEEFDRVQKVVGAHAALTRPKRRRRHRYGCRRQRCGGICGCFWIAGMMGAMIVRGGGGGSLVARGAL